LQLFEELEMFEEIIQCYVVMNKKAQGIEVAQQRIAIEPTPSLYCTLAELTDRPELYETAWELSGNRYARAKRMLARALIRNGQFEQSIQHFEDALAINPLYPATWFSFGCALMQVGNYSRASIAFSRMLQLEPEDGEAWCNLAAVYTRLNKPYVLQFN
jgi:tetratricopeptide (TPR) repeat protein